MRIFVTGASGWIGSAVVPELQAHGHEVIGLARSDASAAALDAAGATVLRGDLHDLDSLRRGAEAADGVIHLAFVHDFANFAASTATDRAAIDVFGDVLAGSGRPLVIASGLLGLEFGRPSTEDDRPAPTNPRAANALAALELADRGVRVSVVRLAPTVHGAGDTGFIATAVGIARERGVSASIGDGANRWPAVHRSDAATLFRLAVEQAAPGAVLQGTAEEGVPVRTIAEVIGRQLGLPVTSVAREDAAAHFGWLGPFLAMDAPASNDITRRTLGWQPSGPTLLEDLESGVYTGTPAAVSGA